MANLGQAPSPTNMVHHIGIAVQNLEAALGVYRDFEGDANGHRSSCSARHRALHL